MGRKTRRQPVVPNDKKVSEPRDIEFITPEAGHSMLAANKPSHVASGLIKLKPITALINTADDDVLASRFAFGENAIQDPFCELSQEKQVRSPPPENEKENCPEDQLNLSTGSASAIEVSAGQGDSKDETVNEEKVDAEPQLITPAKTNRKFKKPLTGNYHKVTDFFAVTPRKTLTQNKENVVHNKDKKSVTQSQNKPSSAVPSNNSLPQQYKDSKSCQPITKFDVRRKLCRSTNLRKVSNRYHTKEQAKIREFYERTGGGEGTSSYYKTYSSSYFPVMISGEFDLNRVMEMLQDNVNHSELYIDVDQQKRTILINAKEGLNLAYQEEVVSSIRNSLDHSGEYIVQERPKEELAVEKLDSMPELAIMEGIEDDVISISSSDNDFMPSTPVDKKAKIVKPPVRKSGRKAPKKTKSKAPIKAKKVKEKVVCPHYKIVNGTTFAVDAFRYGTIDGVTSYFLSHFHSDHYVGLTKKFAHPLYMSRVTANLVRKILKVDERYIHQIELNVPVMVDDVEVTALDANHCPGAVMFVFKLPNGTCILHVGDFRATPEMETEPIFWNNHISTIYLDTTYLTGKYEHPTQSESIANMIDFVDKYREQNIGVKYVIIVGTYVIGKERVWSSLARHLGCTVFLEKSRQAAVECYEDASLLGLLEVDPSKALIHVLPLQTLFYENLQSYLAQFEDVLTHVLAIRPSGWERNSRVQRRGPITIMGIQYSEHSSYPELERFVRHLKPDEVISTVPVGSDVSKVPKVPADWLSKEVVPKRSGQRSITTFLKVQRNAGSQRVSKESSGSESEDGALDLSMRVSANRSINHDRDGL